MKTKLISLVVASFGLVAAHAATYSVTIPVGGFSNLLSGFNGSAKVTQIIVAAPTATNTFVKFVDTPTNSLTYTTSAYTNTTSYITNLVTVWTNYFGATNYMTNTVLVSGVSQVVAAATNNYPVVVNAGAAASTASTFSGVNYYFNNGIWVTNTSTGTAAVTITYQQ